MKILKKCGLLLLVLSFLCTMQAGAAAIDGSTFVPDYTSGRIQLQGILEYEGDAAVYIVYKTDSMADYAVDSVYQLETTEKVFTLDKKLNHASCNVTVYVSGSDSREQTAAYHFYFPAAAEYDAAMGSFSTLSGIQELFATESGELKNKNILGVLFGAEEIAGSSSVLVKYNALICQALYDGITAGQLDPQADFPAVQKLLYQLCAINAIPGGDAGAVTAILENTPALELDQAGLYDIYRETCFTAGFAGDVAARLAGYQQFENVAAFYTAFNEAVLLAGVKNLQAGAAMNVSAFIEKASTLFTGVKFDLSAYNALGSKKGKVDKLIANNTYASVEALAKAFGNAIAEIDGQSSSTGGNRGNGGGGGGGGYSGKDKYGDDLVYSDENINYGIKPETSIADKVIFADLSAALWAQEEINALVDKGIISGYSDNTFGPGLSVTRAEFLKILLCALGLDSQAAGTVDFADVTGDDWFYKYVAIAYEAGIAAGVGDGQFAPNAPISRGELVTMLHRALQHTGFTAFGEEAVSFTDADQIPDWAAAAVDAICSLGVVKGFEDGSFGADSNATRAQAAVMIYRLLEGLGY